MKYRYARSGLAAAAHANALLTVVRDYLVLPASRQAEFMLKRSQRIRSQEDLVLPLFEPLAKNAAEGDYRAPFFSILCGLAMASNDTMWEKLNFIASLFDVNDNKVCQKLYWMFVSSGVPIDTFAITSQTALVDLV